MPSNTGYVAAITLFGLATLVRAVADFLGGASGIGTSLGIVGGLIILIGVGAALLDDDQSMGAPESRFLRVAVIGGALLYTAGAVVDLLT